jgi:hypothetical protein
MVGGSFGPACWWRGTAIGGVFSAPLSRSWGPASRPVSIFQTVSLRTRVNRARRASDNGRLGGCARPLPALTFDTPLTTGERSSSIAPQGPEGRGEHAQVAVGVGLSVGFGPAIRGGGSGPGTADPVHERVALLRGERRRQDPRAHRRRQERPDRPSRRRRPYLGQQTPQTPTW